MQSGVEMDHLHQRMDAGIGTPSTTRDDPLARELRKCRFKPVLHGETAALALPALVRLAAVADAERKPLPALGQVFRGYRVRLQSIEARKRCALAFNVPEDSPITSCAKLRAPSTSPIALNASASASLVESESPSSAPTEALVAVRAA